MKSQIFWIAHALPGKLAIMPRPRGGDWLEDEVRSWRSEGVDVIVSLLTPDEISELDLAHEKSLCEAHGIEFLAFPIEDRGVPTSKERMQKLVSELMEILRDGRGVAIHCRQGIGRSALVAGAILTAQGVDPETAIAAVSAARGCSVPETIEQKRWLGEFVKTSQTLVSK